MPEVKHGLRGIAVWRKVRESGGKSNVLGIYLNRGARSQAVRLFRRHGYFLRRKRVRIYAVCRSPFR